MRKVGRQVIGAVDPCDPENLAEGRGCSSGVQSRAGLLQSRIQKGKGKATGRTLFELAQVLESGPSRAKPLAGFVLGAV